MAWRTIPGIIGKVYQPVSHGRRRKHPCHDCFDCQQCGEDRCTLCRGENESGQDVVDCCPDVSAEEVRS